MNSAIYGFPYPKTSFAVSSIALGGDCNTFVLFNTLWRNLIDMPEGGERLPRKITQAIPDKSAVIYLNITNP